MKYINRKAYLILHWIHKTPDVSLTIRSRMIASVMLGCLWLALAVAFVFLFSQNTYAQQGIINTIAGYGIGDGEAATIAQLNYPQGVFVDSTGNLYITDKHNYRIRKVDTSGTISTIAGTGTSGYSGDGGAATNAEFSVLIGLFVDSAGNVYVADSNNHRIRKIDTSGIITTLAGTGSSGYSGDGSAATSAELNRPSGVCVDSAGNVYIADSHNERIRKIDTSGTITTIAGTGHPGYSGDGGAATSATLFQPSGVDVDSSGNLYIADKQNHCIRKVDTSGNISTIAGTGIGGFSGDGGAATSAKLKEPYTVSADSAGNVYIADTYNRRIRKIDTSGTITTIAGTGTAGFSGDGGAATSAQLQLNINSGVCVDSAGNVYIADSLNNRIRKVDTSGNISTVAGVGLDYTGDGGAATNAVLDNPYGVALDSTGNLYIADTFHHRIRKVDTSGNISTIAGTGSSGFSGDGGGASSAKLSNPYGVYVDSTGNVYIADRGNRRIRKIDTFGIITTIAGMGSSGYTGDGGAATSARMNPNGVYVDSADNVYIVDMSRSCIRKVDSSGIITTIAGTGSAGYSGDGSAATSAQLYHPGGVAVDSAGNVYIGDKGNHCIRKIDTSGIISTIAGKGTLGFSGDGGIATNAKFYYPTGVFVDRGGNIYIADSENMRIRKVNGNSAPTGISLDNSAAAENQSSGTVVGNLSTTDIDTGDSHTYSLVSGTGDTDNASFQISGSQLQTNAVFDYETKSSYSIRLRATDDGTGNLTYEEQFTITITDVNDAPTGITLSANTIAENQSSGTTVGTFTTTDDDTGDTHTYSLVSGSGDTDNGSFQISGNQLQSNAVFDCETKSSYSIRLRATDSGSGNLTYEEPFTITITNVNEAPTGIAISANTIAENLSSGTTVGTLTTTDVDTGDTHSYSLVSGSGDTDNGSFQISGNQLQSNAVFNFETKSSYSIRLRVTDSGSGNLTYEEQFTVTITNVNDAPSDIALSANTIDENQSSGTTVGTLTAADDDTSDTHTFSLVSGSGDTDNGSFQLSGNQLQSNAEFDCETKNSYSIRIRATDNGSGNLTYEEPFTITITSVNEAPTDIALDSSTVLENKPTGTAVGTLTATDVDTGDTHTYSLVSGTGDTDNGSFQITGNQLQTNEVFDFETKTSYSIRLRVTDSGTGNLTYEKPFTITITDEIENQSPIANSDTVATNEDTPINIDAALLQTNDSDPDNDPLYITGVNNAVNGSVTFSTPTITFTPNTNFSGGASFTYILSDGTVTANGQVVVDVTPVNDAPTVADRTINVNERSSHSITLTANDPDGDSLIYILVSNPSNGTVSDFNASNGSLIYTPNANLVNQNYLAVDSFTYKVNDTTMESNVGTVTINVMNVNEAPVANAVSVGVSQNGSVLIQMNGIDPDGDTLMYSIASQPSNGSLSSWDLSNGTITYTPNGVLGNDSFSYTVTDGVLTSAPATVSISIEEGPTSTPTSTPSNTPSHTPTLTFTPTPTLTPTATNTVDPNASPTPTPTFTDTPTPTHTPTVTPTPTHTETQTPTETNTPRPNNHPPTIALTTDIPETVELNKRFTIRLFMQDEDMDMITLSTSENAPVLDQHVISAGGASMVIVEIDTVKAGTFSFSFIAYDGSDSAEVGITLNIVDPAVVTPSPTLQATQTPTLESTATDTPIPPTPTNTMIQVQATNTPTLQSTFTDTPVPTPTPVISTPIPNTPTPVPTANQPTSVVAALSLDGSAIDVSWESAPNEEYVVFRYFNLQQSGFMRLSGTENSVSFPVDLGEGVYTFYVRGFTSPVLSLPARSNAVDTRPETLPVPLPVKPELVNAELVDEGVLVSWLSESNFRFVVHAHKDAVFQSQMIADGTAESAVFPFHTLFEAEDTEGGEFSFFVRGENELGDASDWETASDKLVITPPVPAMQLIVTDHENASASIDNGIDHDGNNNREIALKWEVDESQFSSPITDFHIQYFDETTQSFTFLGNTKTGAARSFSWHAGNHHVLRQLRSGPDYGTYSFRVIPRSGNANLGMFVSEAVNLVPAITVTDDINTLEDLSGSQDVDASGEEEMVIRWQFDDADVDLSTAIDFHVFVSVDGNPIQYVGRPGSGSATEFVWRANQGILTNQFISGPQNQTQYHFAVYVISNVRDEQGRFFRYGPYYSSDPVAFNP